MVDDVKYMQRAIELAKNGYGRVNPNPYVGAVIVKDGKVIAEGWHDVFGGPHAERVALANCKESCVGATIYVNLEPCCHHGKTSPCTNAIIESGISRVVVAMVDPNPLVAGKGIEQLRNVGIEVVSGVCEEEARFLNRIFIKYISTGRPWIFVKTAMTLDGKIATKTGDSQWVSGEQERDWVHRQRSKLMGIMVGSGTVSADNPMLNCRCEDCFRQPVRLIVDSSAKISLSSNLVKSAKEFPLVILHTAYADKEKISALNKLGIRTLECVDVNEKIDLSDMISKIGKLGIDSVMVEGGGGLNDALLRGGFIDEVAISIAPKLVGGADAKTPFEGVGIERMADAVELDKISLFALGEDIVIQGLIKK